jgi:hypothetical protein
MTSLALNKISPLTDEQLQTFLCLACDRVGVLISEFGTSESVRDLGAILKVVWSFAMKNKVEPTATAINILKNHEDYSADDSWKPIYYSMLAHGVIVAALEGLGGNRSILKKTCASVANELISIASCLDAPKKEFSQL